MGLDIWATIDGMVRLAAGRLTDARAAVESLPAPEQTGPTELDAMRIATLVQVAVSTDDRNLLQQMVAHAHDAYSRGSAMVRRTAAYALGLAAWHRNDLQDAVRWLGDDVKPFDTPLAPHSLDHLILTARIASATGDIDCRERVLRATQKLQHDAPEIPLLAAVATYAHGILEGDTGALVGAVDMLASSTRPLLHAAAAEDAGFQLIRADRDGDAREQLNTAFDTYTRHEAFADARRVGRELRRLGVERRIVSQARAKTGWDSLTDSELKVVNLISRGATNRATADQLHISLATVKTHVHNAFGKLDISSRSQLTQMMR
jgi:DNA-binding CsgD family transcriptional regulator